MDLYAAIDLRDGGAVRLRRGDYDQETRYGDPRALAEQFERGGASWLHLVDLDAARDGGDANRSLIIEIATHATIPVETGGGIRSVADAATLLDAGVSRVILGTAAMEEPALLGELADRYPGKVAVGLDYRVSPDCIAEVAVRGWMKGAGVSLVDAIAQVSKADICALIVTAIDRDGMLMGPDLEGLHGVLEETEVPVIASGGVSGAADLRELAELRALPSGRTLEGAVVGKALVEGYLSVEEAVQACE